MSALMRFLCTIMAYSIFLLGIVAVSQVVHATTLVRRHHRHNVTATAALNTDHHVAVHRRVRKMAVPLPQKPI